MSSPLPPSSPSSFGKIRSPSESVHCANSDGAETVELVGSTGQLCTDTRCSDNTSLGHSFAATLTSVPRARSLTIMGENSHLTSTFDPKVGRASPACSKNFTGDCNKGLPSSSLLSVDHEADDSCHSSRFFPDDKLNLSSNTSNHGGENFRDFYDNCGTIENIFIDDFDEFESDVDFAGVDIGADFIEEKKRPVVEDGTFGLLSGMYALH